ncbi:hypothetical protein HMPREF1985_00152 [Mitsuokella sp. oral taxon 131 str. W9106]|nr:hypothetical protein HMPREF1985_00152 [Mitsuokella sp. oral taxon 131 str. W9106]
MPCFSFSFMPFYLYTLRHASFRKAPECNSFLLASSNPPKQKRFKSNVREPYSLHAPCVHHKFILVFLE